MLGELKKAFLTFSGSSLKIIEAFLTDKSSRISNNPLTLSEIKGIARLKSKSAEKTKSHYKVIISHLPEHAKFIASERSRKYYNQYISQGREEQEILDKLVQQGVIKRKWKLEKCAFCDKHYWVSHIDISKPIKCPGCDNMINLKGQVVLGYELNELVRLGINEGIIPVILTANFLYNTTSKGFIWVPGIKCQYNQQICDFDLVCICDGHLLAGECKTLSGIKSSSVTWSKISAQLEKTLNIAHNAGMEAFIVSSCHSSYPESFRKKCKVMAKQTKINVALLNSQDLFSGRRYLKRGKHDCPVVIEDLISSEAKNKKMSKKSKDKRIIKFQNMVYTCYKT